MRTERGIRWWEHIAAIKNIGGNNTLEHLLRHKTILHCGWGLGCFTPAAGSHALVSQEKISARKRR